MTRETTAVRSRVAPLFVSLGLLASACQGPERKLIEPHEGVGKVRHEWVVRLTGSSGCGACMSERFLSIARPLLDSLPLYGAHLGYQVVLVGVANAYDERSSLPFLRRFGPFHEVSYGRGWTNSTVLADTLADGSHPLAIPRLLIEYRQVRVDSLAISTGLRGTLVDAVGVDSIAGLGSVQSLARTLDLLTKGTSAPVTATRGGVSR